jgi:hypothetical protein
MSNHSDNEEGVQNITSYTSVHRFSSLYAMRLPALKHHVGEAPLASLDASQPAIGALADNG